MTKDEMIANVAAFWAQFLPEDKREPFRESMTAVLLADNDPRLKTYSDYDPQDNLLAAVRGAGIECRGCMFSSEDIGFPRKTGTLVEHGVLVVKLGYGGPWEPWNDAVHLQLWQEVDSRGRWKQKA